MAAQPDEQVFQRIVEFLERKGQMHSEHDRLCLLFVNAALAGLPQEQKAKLRAEPTAHSEELRAIITAAYNESMEVRGYHDQLRIFLGPAGGTSISVRGDGNIVAGRDLTVHNVPAQLQKQMFEAPLGPETARTQLLRKTLIERLSLEEIKDLCADIGVDAESLDLRTKNSAIRDLISYLMRRNQLDRLLTWLKENRPDITLSD